jgi:hypothetical protein
MEAFTDGRSDSLAEYLKTASEADATTLIAALVTMLSRTRIVASASRYDAIFGSDDGGTTFADMPQTHPAASPEQGAGPPEGETAPSALAGAPTAGSDAECRCSICNEPILAQGGEPINASQADIIKERFGAFVCRDHRPKSKKAAVQEAAF